MADHIIEKENHTGVLSPKDTLPIMAPDTDDQAIARKVYETHVRKKVLDSLDPSSMSFEGRGEVPIKLSMNGEVIDLSLPIKSIPAHRMFEISKAYQECAAHIPRKWNSESEEWDQDQSHHDFPEIALKLMDLTRKLAYDKLLEGIDIPLKDKTGQVIWSNKDTGNRDREAAITVLEQMGIQESQVAAISDAIDNLSLEVQSDDEDAFTKKSTPR